MKKCGCLASWKISRVCHLYPTPNTVAKRSVSVIINQSCADSYTVNLVSGSNIKLKNMNIACIFGKTLSISLLSNFILMTVGTECCQNYFENQGFMVFERFLFSDSKTLKLMHLVFIW